MVEPRVEDRDAFHAGKSSDQKLWCHHTQQLLTSADVHSSQCQLRLQGLSHKPVADTTFVPGMTTRDSTREQAQIQLCLQDAVGAAAGKQWPALRICSRIKVRVNLPALFGDPRCKY